MKSIFLTLSFLFLLSSNSNSNNSTFSNCGEFYLNENIENISFNGKIIEKKKLANKFIIKLEQKEGTIIDLNLYPNKIGKDIYEILKLDDVIRKNKDQYGFILVHKIKNNDKKPKIMVFNKLCSED